MPTRSFLARCCRFVVPTLALVLGQSGCGDGDECPKEEKFDAYVDFDEDGFGDDAQSIRVCTLSRQYADRGGDCDDFDPAVNPYASEVCNGYDDDCDGRSDEYFLTSPYYRDVDEDGWGSLNVAPYWGCEAPVGYTPAVGDCDDADGQVHPDAAEVCNGIDDDCDLYVDDQDESILPSQLDTWYRDSDQDGYGDPNATAATCDQPENTVSNADDCDDSDPLVNPTGDEVCNNSDDNCDGLVDDADPTVDPASFRTFWLDYDTDGFGDPASSTGACMPPPGFVDNDGDCDDLNYLVLGPKPWVADGDGDGFGVLPVITEACEQPDPALADRALGLDCNDADPLVFPGGVEICNAEDDDCDGLFDDQDPDLDPLVSGTDFFRDEDEDGYGDPLHVLRRCNLPPGASVFDTDCDDSDPDVNPDAVEACNTYDDDCDGLTDDEDTGIDPLTLSVFYGDTDLDGFGDEGSGVTVACDAPVGFSASAADCDDADPAVGAPELYYEDLDGDGAGTTTSVTGPACAPSVGYARLGEGLDCDDGDPLSYPGAPEVCGDGVDQDCDGSQTCVLFAEDWESGGIDGLAWPTLTGATALVTDPAVDLYALQLPAGGSTIESAVYDTSGCASLSFDFSGKRGPEVPDIADTVQVEYWTGTAWQSHSEWSGTAYEDESFVDTSIEITSAAARHTDFQVRLRGEDDGVGYADFYVDDLTLTCF